MNPELLEGNSLVQFGGKRTLGSGTKKGKGLEAEKLYRYRMLISDVGE